MGSVVMASAPASMMTMAITQAKIGRSMKKLTMAGAYFAEACSGRGLRLRRLLIRRPVLLGHDLGAGLRQLHPLDDDAVAGLEPGSHQPLIADGAIGREGPQLDVVVRTDDECGGLTLLIVADALLRHQHGILPHAFLDLLAHEHARQQQTLGIGQQRAQRDRARGLVHGHLGELQGAGVGVVAAVFQPYLHLGLPRLVLLEQSRGGLPLRRSRAVVGWVTST